MVDQHGFSDAEWDVVLAVPFAVFFVVAYADGKVARAESRAFAGIAQDVGARANLPQDALVRDVMGHIAQDFDQIKDGLDGRPLATGLPFHQVLSAGRTLLDDMSDQAQAQAFKDRMLSMAEAIAEAWPKFGRRTSVEEQRSLEFVRDALGLAGGRAASDPVEP